MDAVAPAGLEPSLRPLTPVFFALLLTGGHVGMPLLILTFLLSKRVHRHPTIINFCITWMIYSISYCLLVYGGYSRTTTPPRTLCFIQSALVYGAPPMAVIADLAVVIQIWGTFYTTFEPMFFAKLSRTARLLVILSPPYLTLVIFTTAAAYVATNHPGRVSADNGIYCAIHVERFARYAVPVFCTGILLVITGLEVSIAVKCYCGWKRIKEVCPDADVRRPSLSPCFRAAVFLLYSWITFGACILFLTASVIMNPFPYMAQAALPLTATIVFGSQEDIATAWCTWVWKRRKKPNTAYSSEPRSIAGATGSSRGSRSERGNISNTAASDCNASEIANRIALIA